MAQTFALGHVLAARYRIIELRGVGRTAEVYLAEDVSLQRRVVVKVLLGELAAHEEVRRAFRDHIVRASILSHPHLARVFDGGQESGSIFMISEFFDGGSFEEVLNSGRLLSVDDSARLGRDVASALAYIHEYSFVLGTLAPSKLFFDDDGRVRVSDVALAGIGTNYRQKMTLNDARYLSPEQAIGEPATAKSDVYALSLILFEAVTGSAAYEGNTPETILRARLDAPLPVRLELGTLDMILAQAAVPDPRLRLSAEQLSSRLGGVVADATPLSVRPGSVEVPLLAQFAPPGRRESIGFRAPSADQIVAGSLEGTGAFARAPRNRAVLPRDSSSDLPGPVAHTPRFDRAQYDLPPKSPRRWGYLIVALVILLGALGASAAWRLGLFKKSLPVPNLVGLSLSQASTRLAHDGFTLSLSQRVHSTRFAANDILSQSPRAGAVEKAGQIIAVTVSQGAGSVALPSLVGDTCAKATATLLALRVSASCPTSAEIFSSTPANEVARVLYHANVNPTTVPRGSAVVLSLSKGTAPSTSTTSSTSTTTTLARQGLRPVPNVVGDDQAQVYAAMRAAQLYFTTTGPNSNSTRWTKVVSENPVAGTMVAKKSSVALTVR